MQKTRIRNIEELRTQTIEAFEMVRDDPRRVAQGKELGNLAGKVISSAKLQLDYASARKEKPDIQFLNSLTESMKPVADHMTENQE
jgi:hypothetical protein